MYRCDQCVIGPRGHGFEGALSLIAFIKNPNQHSLGHPDRGWSVGAKVWEQPTTPRGLVEKSQRNGIIRTSGKVRDKINPLAIDGSTRADGDDDEAHARRDVTVLMAPRVSRNRKVSS